ncbi:MAG TPA: hypothetical protein VII13_00010 [Vicinamibacteria bacterium]|jgi:hypothetical protein
MGAQRWVVLAGLVVLSCSGDHSPVAENPAAAPQGAAPAGWTVTNGNTLTETFADGTKRATHLAAAPATLVRSATNGSPVMVLKTTPAFVDTTPPSITGEAPLTVKFNLCQSSDPDQNEANPEQGDTLNWQFHFGDSGNPAFDEDGTFKPDFDHFCRVEHTYAKGEYTATVAVTDKHLEDQAKDVVALARVTQSIRIRSGPTSCPMPDSSVAWSLNFHPDIFQSSCTCPATGETVPVITIIGPNPGGFVGACLEAGGFPIFGTSFPPNACVCADGFPFPGPV